MYRIPGIVSLIAKKSRNENRELTSEEVVTIAGQISRHLNNPAFIKAVKAPIETYDPTYKDLIIEESKVEGDPNAMDIENQVKVIQRPEKKVHYRDSSSNCTKWTFQSSCHAIASESHLDKGWKVADMV